MTSTGIAKISGTGQLIDESKDEPLTKRERFAMAAMQGLCANAFFPEWSFSHLAQLARKQADALTAELDAHPNP
jgi:hypothetical protein